MKITLAVPYDGHSPDETIDVDLVDGKRLIRDGFARLPAPPPLAGSGSSRDAWVDYAADAGVPVPDDAKRADVVAAVADAGAPVPAQPTEDSPTTGKTKGKE